MTERFPPWFRGLFLGTHVLISLICLGILSFLGSYLIFPFPPEYFRGGGDSIRILDRHGDLLRETANAQGLRAITVGLKDIAPEVIDCLVAFEDKRFFEHGGVDFWALPRALGTNLSKGEVYSGGSTLTMQVVRLIEGTGHGFFDKIYQGFEALRLEALVSKDWILETYLNRAPFGGGSRGVEAASRMYLGKPSSHLNLSEAAFLTGLPQAPGRLDPFKNPEGAERRRREVLERLRKVQRYTDAEIDSALQNPPTVRDRQSSLVAGHFTDFVLQTPGLSGRVETTLDGKLNRIVEDIVKTHVQSHKTTGQNQAAVVILDNLTGEILSLVGSENWSSVEEGAVNGALALRQPGSSLKPFLYADSFETGRYSPATVLPDIETEYYGADQTLYIPQNYSQTYRGPVTIKEALSLSLNIPAVRMASERGLESVFRGLKAWGFKHWTQDDQHYGLGIVIGNAEVTLVELAGAYSTLARGGVFLEPTPFFRKNPGPGQRVVSEASAWMVTSILSDERMRVQAFGSTNPLIFGFPLAVKTGTSNQWRDSWTSGYTSRFTVAVWTGDFGAQPMDRVSGATGAGVLFRKVILAMMAWDPRSPELPPRSLETETVTVCTLSGDLPGPACPGTLSVDLPIKKELPTCSVHRKTLVDTWTGKLADSQTPKFRLKEKIGTYLPRIYDDWLKSKGQTPPPQEAANPMVQSILLITKPRNLDQFLLEPGYDRRTQTLELRAQAPPSLGSVGWFVDGKLFEEVKWPYKTQWPIEIGHHKLEIRKGDLVSPVVEIDVKGPQVLKVY